MLPRFRRKGKNEQEQWQKVLKKTTYKKEVLVGERNVTRVNTKCWPLPADWLQELGKALKINTRYGNSLKLQIAPPSDWLKALLISSKLLRKGIDMRIKMSGRWADYFIQQGKVNLEMVQSAVNNHMHMKKDDTENSAFLC